MGVKRVSEWDSAVTGIAPARNTTNRPACLPGYKAGRTRRSGDLRDTILKVLRRVRRLSSVPASHDFTPNYSSRRWHVPKKGGKSAVVVAAQIFVRRTTKRGLRRLRHCSYVPTLLPAAADRLSFDRRPVC